MDCKIYMRAHQKCLILESIIYMKKNQEHSLEVGKESGLYCAEALGSSIAGAACGRKLPVSYLPAPKDLGD